MVDAKLARLKLLMGEEELERLSHEQYNPPVPEVPRLSHIPPSAIQTGKHHPSSSTPQDVANDALEPVVSASEDDWSRPLSTNARHGKEKSTAQLHLSDVVQPDPESRPLGQLAALGQTFCPILAVSKYPYRYLYSSSATADLVSQNFFAAGKFWARQWTIYYIHVPISVSVKPLLLVPSGEVNILIQEINNKLGLHLDFPARSHERAFRIDFLDDKTPRPRFLGICTSRTSFDIMEKKVPPEDFRVKGEETKVDITDDRSYAAFKAKMELAVQATKNKSKASKEKKKITRVHQKQSWCRQLKRTQRYLGLRLRRTSNEDPYCDPNLTWEETVKANESQDQAAKVTLSKLDVEKLVPYPFDSDVVFVSVDVESYERNHNFITEIGISTLDTHDLAEIAPGERGANWMRKIRARHFRISEFTHLVNKDFIVGCADRFEKDFGESEFISIKDAPGIVASFFRPPFRPSLDSANWNALEDHESDSKRNIILVGHDTKTDIAYLRDMGYDPSNLPNLLEVLDTAELFRALVYDIQPKGLGGLLLDLGMTGWNLHNAGNDAAYTLQALIAISFKGLAAKHERQAMIKDPQVRVDEAVKDAEERILDDAEEWGLADGNDDGGSPDFKFEKPPFRPDAYGSTQRADNTRAKTGSTRGRTRAGSHSGSGSGHGYGRAGIMGPDGEVTWVSLET